MHVAVRAFAAVAVVVGSGVVGFLVAKSGTGASPYSNQIVKLGPNSVAVQDALKRNIMVTAEGISCSEPPPDVIGTLVTQLSGKISAAGKGVGNEGDVNAEAARELQSAVEKLFERSQGIQALRDMMFRLCEAMQNKSLEPAMYRSAMFHILGSLNFVVPFEQCAALAEGDESGVTTKDCFTNVVTYSGTMLERLKTESTTFSNVAVLQRQLDAAKVDLSQYQRAFHYLYSNEFAGLPPGLLPDGYTDRLLEDFTKNIVVLSNAGPEKYPYYPPHKIELKGAAPPIVMDEIARYSGVATTPAGQ